MVLKSNRRGQAALEFLTTYGWAFLVILVMIGALSYFGVLNPRSLLPEKCLLPQEFNCKDYRLVVDGSDIDLNMFVQNNKGNSIIFNITGFYLPDAGEDSNVNIPCDGTCTLDLRPSGQGEVSSTLTGAADYVEQGSKVKVIIYGSYKDKGGKYWHDFEGELFATAQ